MTTVVAHNNTGHHSTKFVSRHRTIAQSHIRACHDFEEESGRCHRMAAADEESTRLVSSNIVVPEPVQGSVRARDDAVVRMNSGGGDGGSLISLERADVVAHFEGRLDLAVMERIDAYEFPHAVSQSIDEVLLRATEKEEATTAADTDAADGVALFVVTTSVRSDRNEVLLRACLESLRAHEPDCHIHLLSERSDPERLARVVDPFKATVSVAVAADTAERVTVRREPFAVARAIELTLEDDGGSHRRHRRRYWTTVVVHDSVRLHRPLPRALGRVPLAPLWVFRYPMPACDTETLAEWCEHDFGGLSSSLEPRTTADPARTGSIPLWPLEYKRPTGVFGLMLAMNAEGAARLRDAGWLAFVARQLERRVPAHREPRETLPEHTYGFTRHLAMAAERLLGLVLMDRCGLHDVSKWALQGRAWRMRGFAREDLPAAPDSDGTSRETFWFSKAFSGR